MHPSGLRGALLTGPTYIEGAEPGDTLEVRVLDIRFRAPYGVNSTQPGNGHPLADIVPRPWTHKYDLDFTKNVAIFKQGEIELPLAPFMGQMGVAPSAQCWCFRRQSADCHHGGNFDLQELSRGGTLFLPVNVPGALFFTGNGHALQGNGEITNPSLEVSLTGYFQFIVHKKAEPEDAAHGDADALCVRRHPRFAGRGDAPGDAGKAVEFLQKKERTGFLRRLCADERGVDFTVARALLPAQMVYCLVPKEHLARPRRRTGIRGRCRRSTERWLPARTEPCRRSAPKPGS